MKKVSLLDGINLKAMISSLLRFSVSLVLLSSVFACTTEPKNLPKSFTVSGNIPGLDTEFMSYSYRNSNGKRVHDSVFVKDNKFIYTAQINVPTHIIFWPNVERTIKRSGRGYYPAKSSQFAFLASPGDEIVFEGEITDFVNAYPTGTKGNDELAEINQRIFPLMNQSVNIQLEINKLEESDPKRETLQASMTKIDEEVMAIKKGFVTSNLMSEAAAWYLSDMMIRSQVTEDESIEFFKSLDSSLSDYPFYQAVAQRVEGIESTKVGTIMPNFTTDATNNGETFELNSLRGKYVLIDFWGTWCAPCIAEMPKVKAYKEKYSDKLVIIGVNSGDTMEKILKFTEPKSYDWIQMLAASGDQDLVLRLNVAGFPTKFILSPEGEILNRFVGDTEEAFDVLDELLE